MKGLGCASRETGHKRLPAPPQMITGISIYENSFAKVVLRCVAWQQVPIRTMAERVLQASA
jgi:hypothetical protein